MSIDTAPRSYDRADGDRPAPGPRPPVFRRSFSHTGIVVGALFMAASVTPSLVPRSGAVQGVVSGITLAIGYGLGAAGSALWRYLEVPALHGRARTVVLWSLLGVAGVVIGLQVWQFVGWQNDQRALMGMNPIGPAVWPVIAGVSAAVFAVLLVLGRSLRRLTSAVIGRFQRWLPHRLSTALGVTVVLLLAWLLFSGLLVRGFFAAANAMFAPRNDINKAGVSAPPTSTLRSGGPGSLVTWQSLGREGRAFVVKGPTQADLRRQSPAAPALEPIRVYAGLDSAPTPQARADLVLAELKRTGAFDRKVLVLASTTGSGFIQPEGIDPLEYLWHGDTAVAGIQYSYLPSWLSLLADQDNAQAAAGAVARTVYAYWQTLPEQSRPKLYLYGLSLGSFGAEGVLGSIELLNRPIDGALLVGPPFLNPLHTRLTAAREPGTPAWRPVYQQGRTVRFTVQQPTLLSLPGQGSQWGPVRVAYLQHGSDPVVFFSPSQFFSRPEWLDGPRAPDVSTRLTWYPLVTGWQTLLDLAGAGGVPWGYGHLYDASENLTSWAAVTQPPGWTDAQLADLGHRLNALPKGD